MKKFRSIFTGLLQGMFFIGFVQMAIAQSVPLSKLNLAVVAKVSVSRGGGNMNGLNDGLTPVTVGNARPGGGGAGFNRPQPRANFWVQYDWEEPVTTDEIGVYWWNYNNNIRLPESYRFSYWNGSAFVPFENMRGMGRENNQLNLTSFKEVKTTRIRIELDSADRGVTTLLEWVVYKTDNSASPAPVVSAGIDRDVMINGKTYLSATVRSVLPVANLEWKKVSGPGAVEFIGGDKIKGTATFSAVGDYVLALTASDGTQSQTSSIKVKVHEPPKEKR